MHRGYPILYIEFETSMMVEEEILTNYCIIKEGILQARCEDDGGLYSLLEPGQFRANCHTPKQLAASTKLLEPLSNTFTLELLLSQHQPVPSSKTT